MKYLLSGIVGFVLTLIVGMPFQNLIKPREAKAFGSSMKMSAKAAANGRSEVDVKVSPIIRLDDKKDEPRIKFFPQYPMEAAAQKIEGYVTLSFRVSKEGTVQNLKVTESNPPRVFDEAALAAVSKWSFASNSGKALSDQQKLRLNFNLGRNVAGDQRITESEL